MLDTAPIMDRLTKSYVNNIINDHYTEVWSKRWVNLKQCRQTKIWFPTPNKLKAKLLIKENRATFSVVVRWITGHNFLKRHNAIIEPEPHDPKCRFCDLDKFTLSD